MSKLRFLLLFLCGLVMCSSIAFTQGVVQAKPLNGPVSVQCGHSYANQQLDFSNLHAAGHKVVDIQLKGNNSAAVTCPVPVALIGKTGGYAVQTNRGSCNGSENFELDTNNDVYFDCFFGTGYLSVYITQINYVFWYHYTTTIAYTPPNQHWYYCYNHGGTADEGSNDGLVNVININDQQGGICPTPLP